MRGSADSIAITPRSRLVSPPPELSLVAFREDMCSAFLVPNFVWRTYRTPWIEMAAKGHLGQLSLDASRRKPILAAHTTSRQLNLTAPSSTVGC